MLQNIPHQIVQSPARLGLPNPNSPSPQNPKFPSQTSQSQNPPIQPSNQFTTPAVSPTLLPLLPPLPRAQTLLQQMASLASKLFQVSPNRTNWISSYRGSLPTFLSSQAPPSSSESPPSSTTKEVLAEFTTLQAQLFEAVEELQQILDLQDATEKLTREIRSKDSVLLTFANKLKETEHVLDNLVDDYSDYRRLKRTKIVVNNTEDDSTTTLASQLKLSDILSYAHKISYTTFAPPEFGAGGPLKGALPPAPQEEQMRASQLYNFADLDVGLPKTEEKIIEPPFIETPTETSPFVPGISSYLPPPGWKPGMDVVLPDEQMLPPPGWRPGMEVVLPPLDSQLIPPRVEEQVPRPAPRAIGRAPEPIQVRRVDLDIPEGSSSDFSTSDDDSSDDED